MKRGWQKTSNQYSKNISKESIRANVLCLLVSVGENFQKALILLTTQPGQYLLLAFRTLVLMTHECCRSNNTLTIKRRRSPTSRLMVRSGTSCRRLGLSIKRLAASLDTLKTMVASFCVMRGIHQVQLRYQSG